MQYDVSSITVHEEQSILQVLQAINDSGSKFALVLDETQRLVGIVTDGDIRRGLLKGVSVEAQVKAVMNSKPIVARDGLSRDDMLALLNDRIAQIPVLGDDGRVKGIITFKDKNIALDVMSRKICVVGMGHVGITLSVVLADVGFRVYGYDTNPAVIDGLEAGHSHVHEDGLSIYLNRNIGKRLVPVTTLKSVDADVYMITVGTPIDPESKLPVMSHLEDAARAIGSRLKQDDLVVVRSTVPVGATRNVILPILEEISGLKTGSGYFLSFAPERTVEGRAVPELRELPQIVGGYDKKSSALTSRLFGEVTSTIIDAGSLEAAEMVKILNNTFRDVKFAYANQMAMICRELGLDINQVIQAANDSYVRDTIPVPSPGVGGPCLTKDPYLLYYGCRDLKTKPEIVLTSRRINQEMIQRIAANLDREIRNLNRSVAKIFLIGVAFKGEPETSDIRESSTLVLVDQLRKRGYPGMSFFAYDAVVSSEQISKCGMTPASLADGFREADAVVVMTNHKSHKKIDIFRLIGTTNKPCILIDGWRTFNPEDMREIEHVIYLGLGC